jgi:WD40 repeat protein/energy-coupling factor transporter ATP-binding protein EcfA2
MTSSAPDERTESPYPGLRPFEAHEAHLFFGRDEQIGELLRRLRHHRFLAIVGTSGCGKSSLVKAGLLPNLRGGGMVAAGSAWRIAAMRPGSDPIGHLAAALNAPEVFGSESPAEGELPVTAFTEATLRRGPLGLVDVTRQFRLAAHENLLVLVDQFEEIFRFARLVAADARDEPHAVPAAPATAARHDDRTAFVKLLLEAAHQQDQAIYVVLTMRSDFLGDCARFRGLPEAINDGQYLVPSLTRAQLREAIEGPAAVAGATVSPTLVQALLSEVGEQDRLPVLQHALMRTWTLGAGAPVLDLPAYEATGGMAHALSRHADEAYEELTPQERQMAKRLFQRLTHGRGRGRGTRRPSRLGEICEVVEAPIEDVVRVIDAFRRPDRSFLMPPHGVPLTPDSTIDISHESLMRQWARLREWTEQEHESANEYRRLSEAAALHAQGRAGLWSTPELDIALAWKAEQRPTPAWARRYNAEFEPAMAFLHKSRSRRTMRYGLWAASILTVLIVIGAVAYLANQRGARGSLRVQMAGSVSDPLQRALLLAELGGLAQPDHLPLYWNAAASAIPTAVLGGRDGETWIGSAFIDAGRRITRISDRGRVSERSADGRGMPVTRQELLREEDGDDVPDAPFKAMSATPDGRWIGILSDRAVDLIDVNNERRTRLLRLDSDDSGAPLMALAVSPDASRVAASLASGVVQLWDLDGTGAVLREWVLPVVRSGQDPAADPIVGLQFDPAGDRLAMGMAGGTVRIVPLDAQQSPLILEPAQRDGEIMLLWKLAFSPDGHWVAAAYSDGSAGSARIWNSGRPGAPLILTGHAGQVVAVAFSPERITGDQLRVATGSGDASARLWTLRVRNNAAANGTEARTGLEVSGSSLLLAGHGAAVTHVTFNPDGTRLATTSEDGTTRIWRTAPLEPLVLGRHEGEIESVAFSPDGRAVATSSRDHTARVWNLDGSGTVAVLAGHADWVRGAAFSPVDPSTIVTASQDGTVRLWRLTPDPVERQIWRPGAHPFGVAFSPDGRRLAVGLDDNTALVLPVEGDGQPLVLGHDGWVFDVAFDRAGSRVLTAADEDTAVVWSVSGERRHDLPLQGSLARRDRRVLGVAFSPDGTRAATASADNMAVLWTLPERAGSPVQREPWSIHHSSAVNDVAFDPTGDWVVTASDDRTVRLSYASTGRQILAFPHPAAVRAVAFHPTERRIAAGGADGHVRLWRYDVEDLVKLLKDATTACLEPTHRVAFLAESSATAEATYEKCERDAERNVAAAAGR